MLTNARCSQGSSKRSYQPRSGKLVLVWLLATATWLGVGQLATADELWRVGFAKVDITPTEPLRLSGYAVRVESHTGVADPLAARAMVISPADADDDQRSVVLVSIDSIGVTSPMTVELSDWMQERYGVTRDQLVVCSTHSHAAPHLDGLLRNLYRQPSTQQQTAATERYTQQVAAGMRAAIEAAWAARQPAQLAVAQTTAQFAINRRVLKNGQWTGFGEQADGPVDHRVQMMIARTAGGQLLGASFLYACHCTTLGGDFNQISGDWAGLSAARLEQLHPGSVFVPVIGCGADANPNPRGTYEMAQQHAAELVTAIQAKLAQPQASVALAAEAFPVAHFGYAGLAPEQPTAAQIEDYANSESPNEQRWAEHMLAVKREMGRLPETYPMPIHTWQFGDELAWVFLGGEVVVDYQLQIEKELPTRQTWVAAYSDDVFAYVASQRMRSEGGYEVDFSMIYYLQPGRWQNGTQSLIVRRVREIFDEEHSEERPLPPQAALEAVHVPDAYRVELVAAEPLVQDPINLAFGVDGRVWVVEMSDYPLGTPGGGRVKWLADEDGDGRLDLAQIFVEGLSYPTSVMPWRDGVLIIAAPDILFVRDSDGDGRGDQREVWLTGIDEANPQHRASGFEIGLDGWLHFAAGHGTRQLRDPRSGATYDVSHCDVAWNPDTGQVLPQAGETQFIRSRDDFGNWFGNSNSLPMYQYVIEERYRQGSNVRGGGRQDLLTPAVAPPVYPRSRTVDRFNDLYAFNRFTSACSSIVIRVPGFSPPGKTSALVCEPVHNLVARLELSPDGSCFTATHQPSAGEYDFFTSTDPWSRPVRAINAPDGSVWIVDMVRRVIEHPEWIPTAWQQRLNLRAGAELGRIYRVAPGDARLNPPGDLRGDSPRMLAAITSNNGALRDLGLQAILHADAEVQGGLEPQLRRLATEHQAAEVRASALGCLQAIGRLRAEDVITTLAAPEPQLVCLGLRLAEHFPQPAPQLRQAVEQSVSRDLGPAVDLQWVLTATHMSGLETEDGLAQVVSRCQEDRWLLRGLALAHDSVQALAILEPLLERYAQPRLLTPAAFEELLQCTAQLWPRCAAADQQRLATRHLTPLLSGSQPKFNTGQLLLLASMGQAQSPSSAADPATKGEFDRLLGEVAHRIVQLTRSDQLSEAEQMTFINLLGSNLCTSETQLELARSWLAADQPLAIRRATLEATRRLRGPEVAELLIDQWRELNASLRATAGATLLSRRDWATALVDALANERIPLGQLDLATLGQLSTYGDRELRNRCLELFGQPSDRAQVVAQYLAAVPAPTHAGQGEKLFAEHCAACHRSQSGKPQLGPALENLNHWTLDQWITGILDPNQAVEPKYRQSTLMTDDGQVTTGLVLQRGEQEVLVGVSDGSLRSIATADIADEKDAGPSLMPVGFEQKLSPEQLSELIGYLRSQR